MLMMLFFSGLRQNNGVIRWLWLPLLCCSEMLWMCWGVSVSFPYQGPIYVCQGRRLVLKAEIKRNPGEIVRLVSWDLKTNGKELRIETNKNPGSSNELIKEFESMPADRYGEFVVTVTDSNGDQTSAFVTVKKSLNPPQASMSLQCSIVPEGTLWDTPVYSWLVNDTQISNQSQLDLSETLERNYTCIINSSQGTSTVYSAVPKGSEPDPGPCPLCIFFIVVAVIEAVVIVKFLLWPCIKKKHRTKHSSQNHNSSGGQNETIPL